MQGSATVMKASFLDAPEKISLREVAVPPIRDDQVLIRVEAVGVCGSDVHYYKHGKLGTFVCDGPLILGHEIAGVIAAVGSGVSRSRLGERVAVEPQRPCMNCEMCLKGRYNLCPKMEFYATPPIHGAFAQYSVIQSIFAHKIPDNVSFEEAALAEPLSVALYANRLGKTTVGNTVLVTGAGPIGILVAQAALAYGATKVYITDLSKERRDFAASISAAIPIDPSLPGLSGTPFDVFIEASGSEKALADGIERLKPGSTIVMVGITPNNVSIPVVTIRDRELNLTGVFRYTQTWPAALELMSMKRVDVAGIITSRHSLDEVDAALRAGTKPGAIKAVVFPNGLPKK